MITAIDASAHCSHTCTCSRFGTRGRVVRLQGSMAISHHLSTASTLQVTRNLFHSHATGTLTVTCSQRIVLFASHKVAAGYPQTDFGYLLVAPRHVRKRLVVLHTAY